MSGSSIGGPLSSTNSIDSFTSSFATSVAKLKDNANLFKNLVSIIPNNTPNVCEMTKYCIRVIKDSMYNFLTRIYNFALYLLNLLKSKPKTSDTVKTIEVEKNEIAPETAGDAYKRVCEVLKNKNFVKIGDGPRNCYIRVFAYIQSESEKGCRPSLRRCLLNVGVKNHHLFIENYKEKIKYLLTFDYNKEDGEITNFEKLKISVDVFFQDEQGKYGVHSFCEPHHEDCYEEFLRSSLTIEELEDVTISLNAPLNDEDLGNIRNLKEVTVTLPESKPIPAIIQTEPSQFSPQDCMHKACDQLIAGYEFPESCNVYFRLSNGKGETVHTVVQLRTNIENKKETVEQKLRELQKMVNFLPTDKINAKMDVFVKNMDDGTSYSWDYIEFSCDKNGDIKANSNRRSYFSPNHNHEDLEVQFSAKIIRQLLNFR